MAVPLEPLGIVGLGRIGLAAARAWLREGYKIFGYDIRPDARKEFADLGGTLMKSSVEVTRHAQIVIVLVLNDEQVREVITGKDGILLASGKDTTVICMSTINQETAEELSVKCAEKNACFVDCPFTGGVVKIPSAGLTLIAAAPPDILGRVRPLLEVIGKIVYAGPRPGQAQAIKHCNQLLVGVTHAATMEVIVLAQRLGLNPYLVSAVAGSGVAGSDYFRLLADSVLNKTASPGGLGQMCKDMTIVSNTMAKVGMNAYVASAAYQYFSAALKRGMSEREGADLIEVVQAATHPDGDANI